MKNEQLELIPSTKSKSTRNNKKVQYFTKAHTLQKSELEIEYQTNITNGLSKSQVKSKLKKYGRNIIPSKKHNPTLCQKLIYSLFCTVFNALLWISAILCLVLYCVDKSNPKDTTNIYLSVVLCLVPVLNCLCAFVYNFDPSKSEPKLRLLPRKVSVIRDNETQQIDPTYLVPGDIVLLRPGMKIPADIRVIECSPDMEIDNSSLTGESELIKLDYRSCDTVPMEANNLCFLGSGLVTGNGIGIVIATGKNTFMGKTMAPNFMRKLSDYCDNNIITQIGNSIMKISVIPLICCTVVFVILLGMNESASRNIIFLIGCILSIVPIGLVFVITRVIFLWAKQMFDGNLSIKTWKTFEKLSKIDVICSDKFGLMTQGILNCNHLYYDGTIKKCNMEENNTKRSDDFLRLIRCGVLCNNAEFINDKIDENAEVKDGRILMFASYHILHEYNGLSIQMYRKNHRKLHEIPYNSSNKFQISICQLTDKYSIGNEFDNDDEKSDDSVNKSKAIILIKGDTNRVLKLCNRYWANGKISELGKEAIDRITDNVNKLRENGEIVVALAELVLDNDTYNVNSYTFSGTGICSANFPTNQFVLIGLISLTDTPRDDISKSISKCQKLGIKNVIITQEHPKTIESFCREIGVINDNISSVIVTGSDMRETSDNNKFWNDTLKHQSIIFARTSTCEKLHIINACKERNLITAITGDGNCGDAPSLKMADIGISLGITGTEVCKEAADIILLDDNFVSIVNGIEISKILFCNLKKSIVFMLASNVPQFITFLVYQIFGIPLPLSITMILLIDLVCNILPAISLIFEKENIFSSKALTDFNYKMIYFPYLEIGMLQAIGCLFSYYVILNSNGLKLQYLYGLDSDNIFTNEYSNSETITHTSLLYCFDSSINNNCYYLPDFSVPTNNSWNKWKNSNKPYVKNSIKMLKNDYNTNINDYLTLDDFLVAWNNGLESNITNDLYTNKLYKKRECWKSNSYCKCNEKHKTKNCKTINGKTSLFPMTTKDRREILYRAQTLCFVSIILIQLVYLIMCKTSTESIFKHGMANSYLNYALLFIVMLICCLIYLLWNTALNTRPIKFVYWNSVVPFLLLTIIYCEVRKCLIRYYR